MMHKLLKVFTISIAFSIVYQISASGSPLRPPKITVLDDDITVTGRPVQDNISHGDLTKCPGWP